MPKSLYRSELSTAKKVSLLAKIKNYHLVLELNGERLSSRTHLASLTIDESESADTIQLVRLPGEKKASRKVQDLIYTAKEAGTDGNDITVEYIEHTPAIAASGLVTITAFAALVSGTDDTIEVAGVTFTAQSGPASPGDPTFQAATSDEATATSLATQINAHATAGPLVTAAADGDEVTITADAPGTGGNALTLLYTDNDTNIGATVSGSGTLAGGAAAIGDAGNEIVQVTGTDIQVTMESGASTADNIRDAIEAEQDSDDLVDVTLYGDADSEQELTDGALPLAEGRDANETEYYDLADITSIRRLRNRKWIIEINPSADPAAD